jgi:hypothetical protein
MKKIVFALCLIAGLNTACNKPFTNYGNSLPWNGLDPISATINTSNFLASSANYTSNSGQPAYASGQYSIFNSVDSTTTIYIISITAPNGGGSENSFNEMNMNLKTFQVNYAIAVYDKNNVVISNKSYSSTVSDKSSYLTLSINSSTYYKGIFYGFLKNNNGTSEYIEVKNGYFNIKK